MTTIEFSVDRPRPGAEVRSFAGHLEASGRGENADEEWHWARVLEIGCGRGFLPSAWRRERCRSVLRRLERHGTLELVEALGRGQELLAVFGTPVSP